VTRRADDHKATNDDDAENLRATWTLNDEDGENPEVNTQFTTRREGGEKDTGRQTPQATYFQSHEDLRGTRATQSRNPQPHVKHEARGVILGQRAVEVGVEAQPLSVLMR
jgi:hypothetical protein